MAEFCVIAFSNLSADGRVLRQIKSLSQLGKVTTIGYGPTPDNSARHFSIPASKAYLPLTFRGLVSLVYRRFHSAFHSTPAVQWCASLLKEIDVDVFVLNDVQTIGLQTYLSNSAKVVVDMHEYAPEEMTDDWRFRLLLSNYYNYLCKHFLESANLVTTVSDSIATKFEQQFRVKTSVVRNVCAWQDLDVTHRQTSVIRLVHAGLASRGRRIEAMIDGVSNLSGYELDLFLVPAPRQTRYFRKLSKKIEKINNVNLCEPVISSALVERLNVYDIGLLVIHPSNFSLANCLPNKLFEFIQARLMIVTGPTPDIETIVRTHDLGVVLDGFSAENIRECLLQIDSETIKKFKKNSDKAAQSITAESESENLKKLIRQII